MYIHTLIIYVLKSIFKFLIFSFFFSASFMDSFAQNYELNIHVKDSSNTAIIQTIPYNKTYNSKEILLSEIDSVSNKLSKLGYINNQYQLT